MHVPSGVAASVTACGSTTPPIHTATPSPSPPPVSQPVTIGQSLCSDSQAGTPLSQATPSCQHAWQPYGLTVVPPADIIAATQATTLAVTAVSSGEPQL